LLVRIHGQPPQLFNPGAPNQPHLSLQLQLSGGANELSTQDRDRAWLLRPSAPGRLPVGNKADLTTVDSSVNAFWQPVANGWQVELALPKPAPGSRLAISLHQGTGLAAGGVVQLPAARLFSRNRDLQQALNSWLEAGQQVRVMDQTGWVIAQQQHTPGPVGADGNRSDATRMANNPSWAQQLGQNVLQALVKANQPEPLAVAEQHWRQAPATLPPQALVRHSDGSLWLSARAGMFGERTLVLEQSLNQLLGISGAALGAVLGRSVLIILGLILVLLGYASWLSWRIGRLARQVGGCVDGDGRISAALPPYTNAGHDELGQLHQKFAQLIRRVQEYNHYLEHFSRRLSHELKTPLAILRSSLDNLDHDGPGEEQQRYLARAQSAEGRLSRILHSMSEATRLEQSLEQVDQELFDLAEVVYQTTAAYQTLDPHHHIVYTGPQQGCPVLGSAELLVQLLDKLVDNARDFTPTGQSIELNLITVAQGWQLSVFNPGSQLPAGADIFFAFVSHREHQPAAEGTHHLGQGLLIAQLIARHHKATLSATNHRQNAMDGVQFCLSLPVARLDTDPD
jgi:signal transduction histidine kinase